MHPIEDYLKLTYTDKSEFARELGITQQHLYLLLRGKRWPSFALAKKISSITGIDLIELWTFNRS